MSLSPVSQVLRSMIGRLSFLRTRDVLIVRSLFGELFEVLFGELFEVLFGDFFRLIDEFDDYYVKMMYIVFFLSFLC